MVLAEKIRYLIAKKQSKWVLVVVIIWYVSINSLHERLVNQPKNKKVVMQQVCVCVQEKDEKKLQLQKKNSSAVLILFQARFRSIQI